MAAARAATGEAGTVSTDAGRCGGLPETWLTGAWMAMGCWTGGASGSGDGS